MKEFINFHIKFSIAYTFYLAFIYIKLSNFTKTYLSIKSFISYEKINANMQFRYSFNQYQLTETTTLVDINIQNYINSISSNHIFFNKESSKVTLAEADES